MISHSLHTCAVVRVMHTSQASRIGRDSPAIIHYVPPSREASLYPALRAFVRTHAHSRKWVKFYLPHMRVLHVHHTCSSVSDLPTDTMAQHSDPRHSEDTPGPSKRPKRECTRLNGVATKCIQAERARLLLFVNRVV